jgi:Flp pilus assembly protein TadB
LKYKKEIFLLIVLMTKREKKVKDKTEKDKTEKKEKKVKDKTEKDKTEKAKKGKDKTEKDKTEKAKKGKGRKVKVMVLLYLVWGKKLLLKMVRPESYLRFILTVT